MARAARLSAWARRYLYPPTGVEVRRLIAIITLAVGIPRLPVLEQTLSFAPQRIGQPEYFGVVCTVVGVLLLVSAHRGRLTAWGRMTAGMGFVVWMTLAYATTSVTSLLIDVALAFSLFAEIMTMRDE